jgi:hypothetical protein
VTPRLRCVTRARVTVKLETMNPFHPLSAPPLAKLPPSTKLIWCYLALEPGTVEAGNRTVAKALALSSKSVVQGVAQLEALGLLEVLDRGVGPKQRIVRVIWPKAIGQKP